MSNPNPNPITRFKPGEEWQGNRGGRPKGRSLTAILREALDATEIGGKPIENGDRVADVLVNALIGHAVAGNASLMKEILNRVDGPVLPVEVEDEANIRDSLGEAETADNGYEPDQSPESRQPPGEVPG